MLYAFLNFVLRSVGFLIAEEFIALAGGLSQRENLGLRFA